MHPRTIAPRPITATLAAALLALTLAACGGEAAADPDPTATQPPTEATRTAASPADRPTNGIPAFPEEVTTCLADRGYADATAAGAARDPEFQAALEDCATETGVDLPFAAGGAPAGGGRAGFDPAGLAECLASEGIEVDPDDGDAASGPAGLLGALDRADPEVAAALEACGLPTGGRGPAQ